MATVICGAVWLLGPAAVYYQTIERFPPRPSSTPGRRQHLIPQAGRQAPATGASSPAGLRTKGYSQEYSSRPWPNRKDSTFSSANALRATGSNSRSQLNLVLTT